MIKRKIVQIDEDKCNGCGVCVPNCHEGAIQIIDGKARLIDDKYCDGLGDCLGECPEGAITIIEREAKEYDEEAVEQRMKEKRRESQADKKKEVQFSGCPGSRARKVESAGSKQSAGVSTDDVEIKIKSQLNQWPVQLMLVPEQADHYNDAELLLTADCVPFAYPNYHLDLLKDKVAITGCPKLDDIQFYLEKLTNIIEKNDLKSITVAYMEVPCCSGIVRAAELAVENSSKDIPINKVRIGINGEIKG